MPSSHTSALRYAAAAFLMVTLPGLLLIRRWAVPIPFGDQWDGELLAQYLPLGQGELSMAVFFEPYNGFHPIVTKRLLDQLLLGLNGGGWDPMLQMVVGLVLVAFTFALLAYVCRLHGNILCARVLLVWLAILALVPLHWENVIWGFQSAIHLYFLFSVAAFAAASATTQSTRYFWIAVACAILASLSFGAAFLPVLCILAVLVLLPTDQHLKSHLVVLVVVSVGSVIMHVSLIDLSGNAGNGTRIDLGVIARALSWPLSPLAPWAAVLSLPIVIHVFWCFLQGRENNTRLDASTLIAIRLLTMLWFWSFSQQLLVRLMRDGTGSRHLELLWFVWLAPLLIGVILWSRSASRRQLLYGVFLFTFGALGTLGAFGSKALTLQEDINTHAKSQTIEFLSLHEVRHGRDRASVMHDYDAHLDTLNRFMLGKCAFDLIENPDTRSILPSYFEDPELYAVLKELSYADQKNRLLLSRKPPHDTFASTATRALVLTSPWLVLVVLGCLLAAGVWSLLRVRTLAAAA